MPTPALHYLLLLLTVVAGAVDAVSFLSLGHVFVVNMTGNLVFLGFAAAGVAEISLTSTLVALLAFMSGSALGGRLGQRFDGARLLSVATAVKVVFVAAALGVVLASRGELDALRRDVVVALLAFAMGAQNASARKIGIPDLTTTVFTMTLTALASESTLAGGSNPRWRWRTLAIGSMLVGAFGGGLCVLHAGIAVALGVVIALLAVAGALAYFAFLAPANAGASARS